MTQSDPAVAPPLPPRADWPGLSAELDAWAAAGRTATFWWRDDDATAPTPELGRLLRLAGAHGAPLALAVIPAEAGPALAEALAAEVVCPSCRTSVPPASRFCGVCGLHFEALAGTGAREA